MFVITVVVATYGFFLFLQGSGEQALPPPLVEGVPRTDQPGAADMPTAVRVDLESPRSEVPQPGPASGWIRGRVVDGTSSDPIVGADVRLVALATGSTPLSPSVQSSDDGRFLLAVAARDEERLEVRAPGRSPRFLRLDGMAPQLDLGDVLLYQAKESRLRVIDPSGAPVAGASVFCRLCNRVVIWGNAAPEAGSGLVFNLDGPAATTDGNGCVVLPQLTFGTHRLLVVRDGFRCHMHDVQVSDDAMEDLGTVTLEPANAVDLTLAREDGGVVREAKVDLELSAVDLLSLTVQGAKVRLAPPPRGDLRVTASTHDADGSYWGSLDGQGSAEVLLRLKVPAVRVLWPKGSTDEPVTLWCFATQDKNLWEQASAVRSLRDGSWHCWPRRGQEVRFVAWSPRMGLGTASATVPRLGVNRVAQSTKSEPTLAWRRLPRRALRIVVGDTPAVGALVIGNVELTDGVVGAIIGGTQRPRARISCISGADGVVELGATGGLRVSARVSLAGCPPVEVELATDAPEETPVRLGRGGEVVVRIADTPLLFRGLRLGVQAKGGAPRWFPVTGSQTRLVGIAPGPTDVILELPAEAGWSLEPPVFDVREIGRPATGLELDRMSVVVDEEAVRAYLSVAHGPQANLSVVAPRALRLAVTPIGARSLPKQRAFISSRVSAVTRVCGLFEGIWVVELLDPELRSVWFREVEVARTPMDLFATVPSSTAAVEGGPADAQGVLSAQTRDGRVIPWLQFPVRFAQGSASTTIPEGSYRAELQSSAGTWRGVARVDGPRLVLTAVPR